jgi:hypothetical protein
METSEKPRWSQHDIDVITRDLEVKVGGDIPRQDVRRVVTESFEALRRVAGPGVRTDPGEPPGAGSPPPARSRLI